MESPVFSSEDINQFARELKAISEPNRLLLLEKIIEGVQSNHELGEALQIAPNLVSHHLGVLREAGLVTVERDANDARWVYYSANPEALENLRQRQAARAAATAILDAYDHYFNEFHRVSARARLHFEQRN